MLADYHIVRRYKLKLNDLYTSNPTGIYWYFHGVNWRAPVAFFMGVWPLLRKYTHHQAKPKSPHAKSFLAAGLVKTVTSDSGAALDGWTRLYHLTFIVGLAISGLVFYLLNYFVPPRGLGEEAPFVDDVVHGVPSPKAESERESGDHQQQDSGEKELAKETVGV